MARPKGHTPSEATPTALGLLLWALPVLLVAGACSGNKEQRRPPNVILITLDALRADHLGCYGYARNTSPNLDVLARRSTLYTRAIAPSPWTLPTHASLFTGKYPFQHGAHGFFENTADPWPNAHRLSEEEHTLAETLAGRGYRTAAFMGNSAFLHRWFRLNQGFETYVTETVYGDRLNEKLFPWLHAHGEEPFFLFVNYIDTHLSYNTRPVPGLLEHPCPADSMQRVKRLGEEILPATGPLPRERLQTAIDQYDTAIANVDRAVGALLRRLELLGIEDNTLLVLTSDHGEYFGEHHLMEHSKDVYQPVLWVPLLIKYPDHREGRRVKRWSSLAEVPWLILTHLFPDDSAFPPGAFPVSSENAPVLAELYYTRKKDLFHPVWGKRFGRIRTALFDGPDKYIDSSDGNHELYNLDSDPGERDNLVDVRPERAKELQDRLAAFKASWKTAPPQETPSAPEQALRDEMKALGYLE